MFSLHRRERGCIQTRFHGTPSSLLNEGTVWICLFLLDGCTWLLSHGLLAPEFDVASIRLVIQGTTVLRFAEEIRQDGWSTSH